MSESCQQNSSWPVIYKEDPNYNQGTVEDTWLKDIDNGVTTIQKISEDCYLPLETVIHAVTCRYFDVGEVHKSLTILEEYLSNKRDSALHNLFLRCLLASPDTSQSRFKEESDRWNRYYVKSHSKSSVKFNAVDLSDINKKLTIGIMCGYAKSSLFDIAFSPLFGAISQEKFRCVLFNIGAIDSENLEQYFDTCINLPIFSSSILTQAIEDQKIDILIDLNGRFRMDNPIEVLLKRLAPVQISYGNMLASYSLDCVGYIMTDKYTLLKEDEKYYSEKVYRFKSNVMGTFNLPNTPVSPLPALETNEIVKSEDQPFTFASFNATFKLNDQVLDTWCKILKAVPNSRLLLKSGGVGSARIQQRLIKLVKKYDLDDRITIEGFSPMNEMLDRYKVVDLALNTFPYSGGTTTVYALWNGVPSLTLCRKGMVQSGGGEGVLLDVGLDKFIAGSVEQYIEKAIYFASKKKELELIRKTIRKKLKNSARFNPKIFAQDFSDGLRYIWKDWIESNR